MSSSSADARTDRHCWRPILLCALLCRVAVALAGPPVERLQLPSGFSAELYTDQVPGARQMALGDRGIVYVGTRSEGVVYAVEPGSARRVHRIAHGLHMPSGVAWRNGSLYVAAVERILRYDDLERHLDSPPQPVVLVSDLPGDEAHGWHYLDFGPDDWLYVSIGAPCNICLPPLPYASLQRMHSDGSGRETYARGIRNSVGFTWHPVTHDLWFTDNGRDWLGDDQPSCELNRATGPGGHFGFPYVHGASTRDPEFGSRQGTQTVIPPARELGPHVAPVGLIFYTGTRFPAEYRQSLLIAEHGSWNRSRKNGYRVVRVTLDEQGRVTGEMPFITGWLERETAWGRPTALLQLPDGSVLVADDQAGALYRITYSAPAGGAGS